MTKKIDKTRQSKWIELMRKDVERTFGILKGRWRILKSGVRISGVVNVDKVWFTCCALHNWLLEIDGLNGHLRGGVPFSNWEGELGGLNFDGFHLQSQTQLLSLVPTWTRATTMCLGWAREKM